MNNEEEIQMNNEEEIQYGPWVCDQHNLYYAVKGKRHQAEYNAADEYVRHRVEVKREPKVAYASYYPKRADAGRDPWGAVWCTEIEAKECDTSNGALILKMIEVFD